MAFSSYDDLRAARNAALNQSDTWMLPDYPLKGVAKEQLLAYRLALRELPKLADVEGLENVSLPVPPQL